MIKRHAQYYVYIVKCKNETFYAGYTSNLEKRIERHNKGQEAKYFFCYAPTKVELRRNFLKQNYSFEAEKYSYFFCEEE